MKKVIIFFSLIIFGILIFLGIYFFTINRTNPGYMTRYEWAKSLGDKYGITKPYSSEPLIKDVDATNEYFQYIQTGVEWQIYDRGQDFDGNAPLNGEFMTNTAIKALGTQKFKAILGKAQELTMDDCVSILIKKGYIQRDELSKKVTHVQAQKFLANMSRFQQEVYDSQGFQDYEYASGVVELPQDAIQMYDSDVMSVNINSQYMFSLNEGTILNLHLPYGDRTRMVARKIKSINGTELELEAISNIDEVIKEAEGAGKMNFTIDDIASHYGKVVQQGSVTSARSEKNDKVVAKSMQLKNELINDSGYKLEAEISGANESFEASVTFTEKQTGRFVQIGTDDLDDEKNMIESKNYDEQEKEASTNAGSDDSDADENGAVDDGFHAGAVIDIEQIAVYEEHEFSNGIPQKVAVSAEIKQNLQGNLEGEVTFKQKILTIPVTAGIVSGEINLYLIGTTEGKLEFVKDLSFGREIVYESGEGVRNYEIDMVRKDSEVCSDICAQVGGEIQPVIRLFGIMFFDAEMDVQAEMRASYASRVLEDRELICEDYGVAFPTLSFSVFQEEEDITRHAINFFGELSDSDLEEDFCLRYDVWTYDNAPFTHHIHKENSELVPKCTCEDGELLSSSQIIAAYFRKMKELARGDREIYFNIFKSPLGLMLTATYGTQSRNGARELYLYENGKVNRIDSGNLRENIKYFQKYCLTDDFQLSISDNPSSSDVVTYQLNELQNGKYKKIYEWEVGYKDYEEYEQFEVQRKELLEKCNIDLNEFWKKNESEMHSGGIDISRSYYGLGATEGELVK